MQSSPSHVDSDDEREGTRATLADLIALRRLRASTRKEGIDLDRLNAGSMDGKVKRKKRKQAEQSEQSQYGLKKNGGQAANEGDS